MNFDWKKLAQEIGTYIIAVTVIGSLAWITLRLLGAEIPAANKDAIMMVIGMLVAKVGTIVDWFFGSSKGSSDKTALLDKMVNTSTDNKQ